MTNVPAPNNPQRVLVVVPAYNEAASIRKVIADLRAHVPDAHVAVVDDGSTDDTGTVATEMGATVLELPFNLGIGGALQAGYLYAYENGYEVAVQFDGDGQHRADQIGALLGEMDRSGADLVIGSRLMGKGDYRFPLLRRLGSWLIGAVTFLVTRRRLTDPTSGFRATGRRAIAFFANYYPHAYLESPEATLWVAKQGMRVAETAVEMRMADHSSIGNLSGVFHALRVCLALLIDAIEGRFPESPRARDPKEDPT